LRLGRKEWLEDMRDVACRDALAGIGHRDLERAAANSSRDAKLAALRHRLDRIQAEIPQDLPELLAVDGPEQGRRELANHLEAARAGAVLAAIRPTVARRSACRIRDSIARIAERSSQALIRPSRSPPPDLSAEKVMRTGTVEPSGRRSAVSCRMDARGLPSIVASIEASGTDAPRSADQLQPIACADGTPVISSAAPLNAVIRCARSSAIRPVPADWKIRSLKAC